MRIQTFRGVIESGGGRRKRLCLIQLSSIHVKDARSGRMDEWAHSMSFPAFRKSLESKDIGKLTKLSCRRLREVHALNLTKEEAHKQRQNIRPTFLTQRLCA